MEFDELREALKGVVFDSKRVDCDNFFEAVVVHEEMQKLVERLRRFLGEPVWPSKNRLSFDMEKRVEEAGGLMPGQTLYYTGSGENTVFAMLWPWQDGKHTTVKIIKK